MHGPLREMAVFFRDQAREKICHDAGYGSQYCVIAGLIFSVFWTEAEINFFGAHIIDQWKEKDRFENKAKQVFEHLNMPFEKDKEPMLSVFEAKIIRDELAHGKPSKQSLEEVMMLTHQEHCDIGWGIRSPYETYTLEKLCDLIDAIDSLREQIKERSRLDVNDRSSGVTVTKLLDQ
jgi:hypothetical protein